MKTKCHVCEGEEFAAQGGFYYCTECHTQTQEVREQCDDLHETILLKGSKSRRRKIKEVKNSDDPTKVEWTSWEGFNFILVGLVDEIIELGASPEIRLTTLQLWAAYLKKLEVAFISKEECVLPRLSAAYKQQDRDILYGRIKKAKRKRKKVSSESDFTITDNSILRRRSKKKFMQAEYERASQSMTDQYSLVNESIYSMKSTTTNQSETRRIQFNRNAVKVLKNKMSKNHIKEHRIRADLSCHKMSANSFGSNYVQGPEHLTRSKLLAILYLALLINDADIQLGDLLRFIREGHLKYNSFQKYFPEDFNLTRKFETLFASGIVTTPNHLSLRNLAAKVAKFIDVKKLPAPNLYKLCERYCLELQLPQNLLPIIKKMIDVYPPSFKTTDKLTAIPNYEGRAMSYIIVSLKLLFGLNGVTEKFLSEQADEMNSLDVPISQNDTDKSLSKLLLLDETLTEPRRCKTLFNWNDWVKYIEYRKVVLSYFHRPTKKVLMKENTLEILEQWENLEQQEEEDSDDMKPNPKKDILLKMAREKENKETVFLKNLSASLTPFVSYMDVIVESNLTINKRIIRKEVFSDTDLSFILEPNKDVSKQMKNVNKEVNKLKIKTDYFTYNVYRNKLQDLNKLVSISKAKRPNINYQSEYPQKKRRKRTRLNGNGVEFEEAYDVHLQEHIFNTTEKNGHTGKDIDGTITINDSDTEMVGNKNKRFKHLNAGENYWLYHGLMNKSVTDETFIDIINKLPDSFAWLLNECARTVEMKIKDLYEEVVLTEVIICHVAKPLNEFWNEEVCSDSRTVDKPLANLIKKTTANW